MRQIYQDQSPAYFEIAKGEMTFLCINHALSQDERIIKSVHSIHSYDGEVAIPYDEEREKVQHLAIGESCVISDFNTIVVRIR